MAESRPGVSLIATKGLRYGTRRLKADDDFTANKRDARLLVAIGKARYHTEDARADDDEDDLPALREAYAQKAGKRAFNGWNAETLKAKIAALDEG